MEGGGDRAGLEADCMESKGKADVVVGNNLELYRSSILCSSILCSSLLVVHVSLTLLTNIQSTFSQMTFCFLPRLLTMLIIVIRTTVKSAVLLRIVVECTELDQEVELWKSAV